MVTGHVVAGIPKPGEGEPRPFVRTQGAVAAYCVFHEPYAARPAGVIPAPQLHPTQRLKGPSAGKGVSRVSQDLVGEVTGTLGVVGGGGVAGVLRHHLPVQGRIGSGPFQRSRPEFPALLAAGRARQVHLTAGESLGG